jgi:alpha-tubulin suppressor-like RCC1 family protein
VLTQENEVYAFGAGNYGECGYGEFMDTSKPRLVKFPPKENPPSEERLHNETGNFGAINRRQGAVEIYAKEQHFISDLAAGGRHSMVLTEEGSLFVFGYAANG